MKSKVKLSREEQGAFVYKTILIEQAKEELAKPKEPMKWIDVKYLITQYL